jgi:hypothetical protein
VRFAWRSLKARRQKPGFWDAVCEVKRGWAVAGAGGEEEDGVYGGGGI